MDFSGFPQSERVVRTLYPHFPLPEAYNKYFKDIFAELSETQAVQVINNIIRHVGPHAPELLGVFATYCGVPEAVLAGHLARISMNIEAGARHREPAMPAQTPGNPWIWQPGWPQKHL
ncbi:uncharacterized protein PV06_09583 [Exophiala oligosperma]|uniref:Uncharacterized protein n=1 Tax=Exophiala oligosperma TaxID=215243 RepID=A0A0D2AEP6_9EURO|nr:uncharacterized protein PV06_09583 [Exophiala oligosperma]KIW38631.1 hypothetical protein PV06_09583 [Exophiala oligosperma]